MAKEIQKVLKLQIRGGAANPSPPVGPALGAAGVNIMEFKINLEKFCLLQLQFSRISLLNLL